MMTFLEKRGTFVREGAYFFASAPSPSTGGAKNPSYGTVRFVILETMLAANLLPSTEHRIVY